MSVRAFSSERFVEAVAHYQKTWSVADAALRRLCDEHPSHQHAAGVHAKLLLIGRAYATGIERKIRSGGGQGSSLAQAAQHLLENHTTIDGAVALLPNGADRLDASLAAAVLEAHGRVVGLMSRITRDGQTSRSFASKYLHFHRPVVPLIDTYADRVVRRLTARRELADAPALRPGYEPRYHAYMVRFLHLLGQARQAGHDPTVKELDYYVLWEAGHGWTPPSR